MKTPTTNSARLKFLASLFLIGSVALPCLSSASVYKIWKLKVEILEIYDRKTTASLAPDQPNAVAGGKVVGLKVRYLSCEFVEGHGSLTCRAGQVRDIVLHLKKDEKLPDDLSVGDTLTLLYDHAISRAGQESHHWKLAQAGSGKKD